MRKIARGFLALASCAVLATPAAAQVADHLKCYKIKDPLKLAGTVDLDTPQFGLDPGCRVSKAKLFCVPASKTNVAVEDRGTGPITPLPVSGPQPGDRICYKVRCDQPVADQQATDQFGTRTLGKFKTALVCTPAFKGSARYVDNGDGTVTDNYTGLQWEKKTTAVGSGANLADPHDVDNPYDWSSAGTAANGPAFTDFLSQLNACTSPDGVAVTAVFGGHCDWRLPTIAELKAIRLAPFLCGTSPCIDPVFGPTQANFYWSSTTDTGNPNLAWLVNFDTGDVNPGFKTSAFAPVRAVRGGSSD